MSQANASHACSAERAVSARLYAISRSSAGSMGVGASAGVADDRGGANAGVWRGADTCPGRRSAKDGSEFSGGGGCVAACNRGG